MADSLRDQLLKSGIVRQTHKQTADTGKSGKNNKPKPKPRRAKPDAQATDLARAYAMRAQEDARERKQAKAETEAKARERKEIKRKLQQALAGNALNKPDAEQARHFEYGGKIRRVHVSDEQLAALNEGRLAVVQAEGRYLLVTREVAEQVQAIAAKHVALLIDPDAADADDGVPDDLVW